MSNLKKFNNNSSKYNFTNDQKIALDGILDFIAKEFNPANHIIGLCGAGGVGKTFLTNYIITHCKYSDSVISCTSPTHKACRVFSEAINNKPVTTIQSVFGLRIDLRLEDFNPLKPQFNPRATPKLDNVRLLIVDEASMLPAKLVTYICKVCKENQIKILFIGDPYQLSPVNEKKSIAFDRCQQVYNLNEIVRQKNLNPILKILDLIRNDMSNGTNEFIKYIYNNRNLSDINEIGEGYTICDSNKFKELIDINFSDEEYTKNINKYRIIAYTNMCVSSWNNYIRNSIILNSDRKIITKNDLMMSYETIVDDFLSIILNNSEEYIINDILDYVDEQYEFKGFLVKFQLVNGGKITKPIFVIDHTDNYTIRMYYKTIKDLENIAKNATGGTRASKWGEYYKFKKKYLILNNINDSSGKIIIPRDLDYGFAITSHKSQGSTYNNVFVDLNDMIYNKLGIPYANRDELLRRIYVACSRAKNKLIICYNGDKR